VHAMNTRDRVSVQLHAFLPMVLDGGTLSGVSPLPPVLNKVVAFLSYFMQANGGIIS
jgi:hypothetical protein